MKYRKKEIVEAIQFTLDNIEEVIAWCGGEFYPATVTLEGGGVVTPLDKVPYIMIPTKGNNKMRCNVTEWIVKKADGQIFPLRVETFEELYESIAIVEDVHHEFSFTLIAGQDIKANDPVYVKADGSVHKLPIGIDPAKEGGDKSVQTQNNKE